MDDMERNNLDYDKLESLVAMGFEQDVCIKALTVYENDMDKAIDFLTSVKGSEIRPPALVVPEEEPEEKEPEEKMLKRKPSSNIRKSQSNLNIAVANDTLKKSNSKLKDSLKKSTSDNTISDQPQPSPKKKKTKKKVSD